MAEKGNTVSPPSHSSSSSSGQSPPPTETREALGAKQAAARVAPVGNVPKKRKADDPTGENEITKEEAKRFTKHLVDTNALEATLSKEEAVQARVDQMIAAHAAQSGLAGMAEPSEADEMEEEESSSSRSASSQRGRGVSRAHTRTHNEQPCSCGC